MCTVEYFYVIADLRLEAEIMKALGCLGLYATLQKHFCFSSFRTITLTCAVEYIRVIADGLAFVRGIVVLRHREHAPLGQGSFSSIWTRRSMIFVICSFASFGTSIKGLNIIKFHSLTSFRPIGVIELCHWLLPSCS